jgi:hypothetical protein
MRLAGLRFFLEGHLHIHIPPGVESRSHSFSLWFVGPDLDEGNCHKKQNKNPRLCLRLHNGVIWMHSFNGKPANGRSF